VTKYKKGSLAPRVVSVVEGLDQFVVAYEIGFFAPKRLHRRNTKRTPVPGAGPVLAFEPGARYVSVSPDAERIRQEAGMTRYI
jgi:hypothetical protein